jgi:hypothetical protein
VRTFPNIHRATRLAATLVLAAGCALAATAPPAPARQGRALAMKQVVFSIADAMPDDLVQAGFAGPAGDSTLSPAKCRIKNVQNAHVSTYLAQRGTLATKGNAEAECEHAVPYLSLSVSLLDPDTHTVLAKQAKPKEVTNQSLIQSLETVVTCINSEPTHYQVSALGVSQEDGKYYEQIEFGKIVSVPCGHA